MRIFRQVFVVLVGLGVACTSAWAETSKRSRGFARAGTCSAAAFANIPSPYYGIELVSTKRVPGTARSKGVGRIQYQASPFGISIDSKGNYVYEVTVSVENLKKPRKGAYVAWLTASDLSEVRALGELSEGSAKGPVAWNKFLVVVTLEPDAEDLGATWKGPIVMRGMSRSGLMHTLAGHGPFETEPCSKYGYD